MKNTKWWMLLMTGFLAGVLALSGCGSDSDDDDDDTPAETEDDGTEDDGDGEEDGTEDDGDGAEDGSEDDGDGAMDGADDGPTVSVTAPSYDKEFIVTSCDSPSESTVTLTAEADDIVLDVEATDGVGTLSIEGGNEQDGVDLAGTVTSVAIGDAGNVTIEGTFDSDDGEAFTITGSCS